MIQDGENSRNGKNFIDELRRMRLEKVNNSISVENGYQLGQDLDRSNVTELGKRPRKLKLKNNITGQNSSRDEVNQSVDYLRDMRIQRE